MPSEASPGQPGKRPVGSLLSARFWHFSMMISRTARERRSAALFAAADPAIRCVLVTDSDDESVLIESILAGAWGCLSKLDDSGEQLRLIFRVLTGHTAYSRRFSPALLGPAQEVSLRGAEEKLRTLSNRESAVALGLAKGLSNRQIGQQMFIAEKTVKNMGSSILDKLDMDRRTELAVMVAGAVNRSVAAAGASYRSCGFPDLVFDVTAALWECVSEEPARPGAAGELAATAARLAQTLDATKARPAVPLRFPSRVPRDQAPRATWRLTLRSWFEPMERTGSSNARSLPPGNHRNGQAVHDVPAAKQIY
jgi:two-component system response regulator DevR